MEDDFLKYETIALSHYRARRRDFTVAAISSPTREQIRQFQSSLEPVVIRNVITKWPATRWTLRSFAERFGEEPLAFNNRYTAGAEPKNTIADFVQNMEAYRDDRKAGKAAHAPYAHGFIVPDRIAQDLGPEPVEWGCRATDRYVWMGSQGACGWVHQDKDGSFLAQFVGRKHVSLYSGDQRDVLYARIPRGAYRHGAVNCANREKSLYLFPKFKDAVSVDVTLQPGEILFIPPLMFHFVSALDDVISVNFFEDDGVWEDRAPRAHQIRDASEPSHLSTRSNPGSAHRRP
jgi:hypothetical protein